MQRDGKGSCTGNTETDCRERENKLDSRESRTNEARRLEHIAKGSMRSSRAIQSEDERSQFESISLEDLIVCRIEGFRPRLRES